MLKNVTNNQTPFDIGVSIPGKVIPPGKSRHILFKNIIMGAVFNHRAGM